VNATALRDCKNQQVCGAATKTRTTLLVQELYIYNDIMDASLFIELDAWTSKE
jgi:transcription elongation factor Elf1